MILCILQGGVIMFGFKKSDEVKVKDINEGFRDYEKNPEKIVIVCVDELRVYNELHIADASCLPLRLIDQFEEYYPEKDLIYYLYAYNGYNSRKACQKLMKKNYNVYNLGDFAKYHEYCEGEHATRKDKRRRR